MFVRSKQPDWQRLETLLDSVSTRGLRRLSEDDTRELARLYRKATSDLAQAQTFVRDAEILHYLNGLVGRGHAVVYRAPSFSLASAADFLWREYPARVRRHARPILAAAAILFGAALFGYLVVAFDFEARDYVLPGGIRTVEKQLAEQDHWASDIGADAAPTASAWIMTNNMKVSFLAFASGAFLGAGTFLVLTFNGLMIGALMATLHHYGKLAMLMSFVVGHGVIELTCICIAGGAGFVLASGIVSPGELSMRDALVEKGRESALLVLGTIPLLTIAGLIEGFVSPLAIPYWMHGAFAVIPAGGLAWYLLRRN